MNHWDILIVIVLAIAVVWAIAKIVRNKKQGKTSCGGDCSRCNGCSYSGGDQR